MNTQVNSTKMYMDFSGFEQMRAKAKENDSDTLRKVAQQFESLFMQMMMKSMREANAAFKEGGMFDSDPMNFYQEMFDKQLSLNLSSSQGLGLTDVLVRQLGKTQVTTQAQEPMKPIGDLLSSIKRQAAHTPQQSDAPVAPAKKNSESQRTQFDSPVQFIQSLWEDAKKYAQEIGVNPKVLLAQAALETGWGKAIIHDKSGDTSHNLFNIKATGNWQKDKINIPTLEYLNGDAKKLTQPFRKYDSFSESFKDYIHLIKNNDRYQKALDNTHDSQAYLEHLQASGYATDPHYAKKIHSIYSSDTMNDAIKSLEVK